MLLILVLGLIGKLILVSGDCPPVNTNVTNFDWNQFSGTWWGHLLSPEAFEETFTCVTYTYGNAVGNTSTATLDALLNGTLRILLDGNITYWNSNGYFDQVYSFLGEEVNGTDQIIAVEYDEYYISVECSDDTNQHLVHVAYRNQYPNSTTVEKVNNELHGYNIDVSQLKQVPADNCPPRLIH